jgi:octaprenyl-diphosphate synthase
MPLVLLIVLAAAHLENAHFVVATVRKHGDGDLRTADQRLTECDRITIRNHEYLIEDDLRANICRYLFYFKFFAGGDAILLASGFYDRIHVETPNWGKKLLFADCSKRQNPV